MTRLIAVTSLLVLISTSAQADGPWCAFYGPSTYNCGFHSYDQCYATIRGVGGTCRPNFFQGYGLDRPPPPARRARNTWY